MPYAYETDTRGHKWQEFGGEVDIFAYSDGDIHNGPRCTVCGYGFCHHCQNVPDESCSGSENPENSP
jgi:hypothetical protein